MNKLEKLQGSISQIEWLIDSGINERDRLNLIHANAQEALATFDEVRNMHDELMRDKARLDWLADKNNAIGAVQLPSECVERNLHSLRDAIDDAMELAKAKGEQENE